MQQQVRSFFYASVVLVHLANNLSVTLKKKKTKNLQKSDTGLLHASKIKRGSQMPDPSLGLNGKQPLSRGTKGRIRFLDE